MIGDRAAAVEHALQDRACRCQDEPDRPHTACIEQAHREVYPERFQEGEHAMTSDCIAHTPEIADDQPVRLGNLAASMITAAGLDLGKVAERLHVDVTDLQAGNMNGQQMHRLARIVADSLLMTSRTGVDDVADELRPTVERSLIERLSGADR